MQYTRSILCLSVHVSGLQSCRDPACDVMQTSERFHVYTLSACDRNVCEKHYHFLFSIFILQVKENTNTDTIKLKK